MLHLFNEVFLEHEDRLSVPVGSRVIVISSIYNTDMKINPSCLTCVDTLAELLENNTLEYFFRKTMALKGKIIIYANDEAFSQIIAAWIKSSTHMGTEQYNCYMALYKFRCITNAKRWFTLFDLLPAAWATAPEYNFSDNDFTPSYELLLATAFVDPNFVKKDKLIFLMSKFIKREYEDVILEMRKHIDSLILDKDLQILLGATQYISNIDLETIKIDLPQLQLYREPYWQEDIYGATAKAYRPGTFAVGDSKIDISLSSPEELTALCEFTEDILYSFMSSSPATQDITKSQAVNFFESRGWTYKNSVAYAVLTETEYLTALDEIQFEKYSLTHVPLDLRESIFLHIIPLFKSLKNTGNIEELQKYTLK